MFNPQVGNPGYDSKAEQLAKWWSHYITILKANPDGAAEHERMARELFQIPLTWGTLETSRFAASELSGHGRLDKQGLAAAKPCTKKRHGKLRCCYSLDMLV